MEINPNIRSFGMEDKINLDRIKDGYNRLEDQDDKKLKEVCQDFESVFLYMMMKEMKKNIPDNGLIEKSQGSLMFEDMYMEELSKEISKGENGIGLADMMYDQLKNNNRIIIK